MKLCLKWHKFVFALHLEGGFTPRNVKVPKLLDRTARKIKNMSLEYYLILSALLFATGSHRGPRPQERYYHLYVY